MHVEVTILENSRYYYFQNHIEYSKKGHLCVATVLLYVLTPNRSSIYPVPWEGDKR